MRKYILLFILLALYTSSFAQYINKHGAEYMNLKPIDSPICFIKLDNTATLKKLSKQQEKKEKIARI